MEINLKSQLATLSVENKNENGGKRKLPYVFTEQERNQIIAEDILNRLVEKQIETSQK